VFIMSYAWLHAACRVAAGKFGRSPRRGLRARSHGAPAARSRHRRSWRERRRIAGTRRRIAGATILRRITTRDAAPIQLRSAVDRGSVRRLDREIIARSPRAGSPAVRPRRVSAAVRPAGV
jgi:hypothetical protein